jgi:hypothetical protein
MMNLKTICLDPEACMCFYGNGQRIVVAIGSKGEKNYGLCFHANTVALLYSCASFGGCAGMPLDPDKECPFFINNCDWVPAHTEPVAAHANILKITSNIRRMFLSDPIHAHARSESACYHCGLRDTELVCQSMPIKFAAGITPNKNKRERWRIQCCWLRQIWEVLLEGPGRMRMVEGGQMDLAVSEIGAKQDFLLFN